MHLVSRLSSFPLAASLLAPTLLFATNTQAQTVSVGGSWAQQSPATSPQSRSSATMAYDSATGTIVLFGGLKNGSTLQDTWTWNGTTWTNVTASTVTSTNTPPARSAASMDYDAATASVVLFGGYDSNGNRLQDTWTWNGTTWTNVTASTVTSTNTPPARFYSTMAYDAATGTLVLFGGNGVSGNIQDTWTWNGTTWTNVTAPTVTSTNTPPARYNSAMAYDAATGTVVLFAGYASSSGFLQDTWTWNGATWTNATAATITSANTPSARDVPTMTYDPATGTVVLFGGGNLSSTLQDTWTWNGTTWTNVSAATITSTNTPSPRGSSMMAYDAATGAVVLFAGYNSGSLQDTWTYAAGTFTAPTTNVSTAATTQTPVYFNITGSGTLPALSNSNVLTQGTPGLDFTLGTGNTCTGAVTTGQTCTVNVAFKPSAPGARTGAVDLLDSNNNILATAYMSGTGTGAAITFPSNSTLLPLGGNSFDNPSGTAVDASGNVYVADTFNGAVEKIPYNAGSYGTPITINSDFVIPVGVAVDGAGNIYVADTSMGIVKLPYAAGTYGTPVTLGSGFTGPRGVAVDASGNVYVADPSPSVIVKIPYNAGSYGTQSTLGSGFNGPSGVAVDATGNVYVADSSNHAVKRIPYTAGSYGTPVSLGSGFSTPYGVALDAAGNVYVADYNSTVLVVPYSAGTYGTPIVLGSGFNVPTGIAVDASGNVYVADNDSSAITKLPLATPPVLTFANTAVNGHSATQTITASNVGNTDLTLAIPTTGQNPSLSANYTLSNTSTCPISYSSSSSAATIATGTSCTEILSYTPTLAGATTGNLVFTDNNFAATNAKQTVIVIGNTALPLTMEVIGQNIASGTSSITLEFIVGYGGNTAPTTTPTLTVGNTAATPVTCIVKAGHNNCTAPFNPSALAPGTYTITATQPADGTVYTTDATASAILTVIGNTSTMTRPVMVSTPTPAPSVALARRTPTAVSTSSPTTMTPQVIASPSFIAPPTEIMTMDATTDSDSSTKDKDKSKN
jgi:hypothetical protein